MIEKENLEKNTIRKKYGWFPKISILEDLKDQYQDFFLIEGRNVKTGTDLF